MIWHSHSVADVLQDLQVDPATGLTQQEADIRLKEYGENCLQEQRTLSFRNAFVQHLRAPLTALLLAVSGITLVLDLYKEILHGTQTQWEHSLIAAGLAVAVSVVAALRQRHNHSSMAKIHTLSYPDAQLIRDGQKQDCSTDRLVPGDIVLLQAGDIVPADCRLIEATRLQCDERALTDATLPTDKNAEAVFDDITPLAQRTNMLYAGTAITAGTARAVVVATGVRSEMGHVAAQDDAAPAEWPTQQKVTRVHVLWSVLVTLLSVIALVVGFMQHDDRSAVILTAAVMAMAALPRNVSDTISGLTIRSIRRMARRKVRLHRPETAEMMGKVTVVCAEQETLFQNENIVLEQAYTGAAGSTYSLISSLPQERSAALLMRMAVLNCTQGNPLDDAILAVAARAGIHRDELLMDMPRIGELNPDPQRRVGVHLAGEQTLILVSGDWRSVLPLCTKGDVDKLTAVATAMEADCLQVTAVAYRLADNAPTVYTSDELEHDLTCVGLFGYRIPWQNDLTHIADTTCAARSILFSNDSVVSAVATAKQAGFAPQPKAVTTDEVSAFSETEWDAAVQRYDVYCGLSPEQKIQIITALQRHGEIVAVTASRSDETDLLTAADVGFARGTDATDVAKKAADVLLSDGGYASLMDSLTEGKRLHAAMLCAILYLVVVSLVILCIGFSALIGWTTLQGKSILMLCLHLVLLSFPIPVWSILDLLKKK